jgi:hypothetical protein
MKETGGLQGMIDVARKRMGVDRMSTSSRVEQWLDAEQWSDANLLD